MITAPRSQLHDRGQTVTVVGIVIAALLAIFPFVDMERFLICLSCGILVLGGYMIRCPTTAFGRTASACRIGVIATTIIVPTFLLTSGRVIDEMPNYLERTIENLSDKAKFADWAQAKVIEQKAGPSQIVRWVPNRNQVAILQTKTVGKYLSEVTAAAIQNILWAIVIGVMIVLMGLFVAGKLAAAIEEVKNTTKQNPNQ